MRLSPARLWCTSSTNEAIPLLPSSTTHPRPFTTLIILFPTIKIKTITMVCPICMNKCPIWVSRRPWATPRTWPPFLTATFLLWTVNNADHNENSFQLPKINQSINRQNAMGYFYFLLQSFLNAGCGGGGFFLLDFFHRSSIIKLAQDKKTFFLFLFFSFFFCWPFFYRQFSSFLHSSPISQTNKTTEISSLLDVDSANVLRGEKWGKKFFFLGAFFWKNSSGASNSLVM